MNGFGYPGPGRVTEIGIDPGSLAGDDWVGPVPDDEPGAGSPSWSHISAPGGGGFDEVTGAGQWAIGTGPHAAKIFESATQSPLAVSAAAKAAGMDPADLSRRRLSAAEAAAYAATLGDRSGTPSIWWIVGGVALAFWLFKR